MARKMQYPPKPWLDGQRASLMPGIDFIYSQATKKWVPVTPGYVSSSQLQESFGVSSIQELVVKFENTEKRITNLDSDIQLAGRIWKTTNRPDNPKHNDIWIEQTSGKTLSYVRSTDTWIELNYLG